MKIVSVDDLRRKARRRLPRMMFDFIEGGAEDEQSLQANRRAFDQVHLQPRVLKDVSQRSQAVSVGGQKLSTPVLLAPVGLAQIAGRRGELAAARAASAAGTVSVVSTASSFSIEAVAKEATEPQWFQLYPWGDREAVEAMIGRAERAGYTTMVVTVDVPVTGNRERDARHGFTVPPRPTLRSLANFAVRPGWLAQLALGKPINFANLAAQPGEEGKGVLSLAQRHADLVNPSHTWQDMLWMRDLWPGKVIVKGITCAEDARLVADHGFDGLVVSNHGGRQMDAMAGTLNVLPEVAAEVGDEVDVLLDGGVRRGTDVVKALALGARAVLVGRPWLYGLASGGEAGVSSALEMLRSEIDRTLTLMGKADVSELSPHDVRLTPSFTLPRGAMADDEVTRLSSVTS